MSEGLKYGENEKKADIFAHKHSDRNMAETFINKNLPITNQLYF